MITLIGSAFVAVGLVITIWSFKSSQSSTSLLLSDPHVANQSRGAAINSYLGAIAKIFYLVTPDKRIARLNKVVRLAGEPDTYSLERILLLKFSGAFLAGFMSFLYFIKKPGLFGIVSIVIGVIGGFIVPEMLISSRAKARQDAVRRSLADAIDQLAVTVRAGLSVDYALVRVSETLRGPLAEELRRVVQDIEIGISRSDALRKFAERMDISELNYFVRALIQADSLGVSVSSTLASQSQQMRIRRRLLSEEKAMKLPVKILAPTLLCILPALMIIVLGPAVIQLMRNLQI